MQEQVEEWSERAKACTDYLTRLQLVEEMESHDGTPEFLLTAALRSKRSLTRYIDGGMIVDTDKHDADHHFQSLMFAFP